MVARSNYRGIDEYYRLLLAVLGTLDPHGARKGAQMIMKAWVACLSANIEDARRTILGRPGQRARHVRAGGSPNVVAVRGNNDRDSAARRRKERGATEWP